MTFQDQCVVPEVTLDKRNRRQVRLLYVVNVDWFFLSHRLALAKAAKRAGYEVIVVAGDSGEGERIREEGLGYVPIPVSRDGINPLSEIISLGSLVRVYRRLQPDLIHHVTIKPVLYGSLAARFAGFPAVVNSVTGLGYTFTKDTMARLLRPFVEWAYGLALGYPFHITILQHEEDRRAFLRRNLVSDHKTVIIEGSGVDCEKFVPVPEPSGKDPIVLLPARMLWDKGVREFVEAARRFRAHNPRVRFVLAGRLDEHNPSSVSKREIEKWVREGIVEWWGNRNDMPDVLSQSSIVVLPSYFEGVPKVLLEAAASGRAIVATDIPGCREIVKHHVNGFLVPVKDVESLLDAIKRLIHDRALREKFGRAGRDLVEKHFAQEVVIEKTLKVYQEALNIR